VDEVGEHRQGDLGPDGQDGLADPLVASGADSRRPDQHAPGGVGGQHQPAPGLALATRAGRVGQVDAGGDRLDALLTGRCRVQPHRGHGRVGVDGPAGWPGCPWWPSRR